MERLQGTQITTNIVTNSERVKQGFGLIDSWEVVEKSEDDKRMIAVEITLSKWLYNAINGKEVLTINRDYFRLRKGLERRLYELARKHCGRQTSWKVSLEILYKKSGSGGVLKEFRRKVKSISQSNHLPDYSLFYLADQDCVMFYNRSGKGELKHMTDIVQGKLL